MPSSGLTARAPEERPCPPTGRHGQGRDSGRIAGLGLGQVAGPQGEPPGDPEMERATPPEPGPAMNPPTDTQQRLPGSGVDQGSRHLGAGVLPEDADAAFETRGSAVDLPTGAAG